MTVAELIKALGKVKDQAMPVRILDQSGDFAAEILTVDMDSETVNIVMEDEVKL